MSGHSFRDYYVVPNLPFRSGNGRPPEDDLQVRMTGANFLSNITALIAVVALEAIIFSRVEGWEYFDAIYLATGCSLVQPGNVAISLSVQPIHPVWHFLLCKTALRAES